MFNLHHNFILELIFSIEYDNRQATKHYLPN